MIEIIITRYSTEQYKETRSCELSRTPTEIMEESDYGGRCRKVTYATTSQPLEVTETRKVSRLLLKQEVEDDESFDLAKVIIAVNGL